MKEAIKAEATFTQLNSKYLGFYMPKNLWQFLTRGKKYKITVEEI